MLELIKIGGEVFITLGNYLEQSVKFSEEDWNEHYYQIIEQLVAEKCF